MSRYEVPEPVINSPFDEPTPYWHIVGGEQPVRRDGRRPAMYFYRDPKFCLGRALPNEVALDRIRSRERFSSMPIIRLRCSAGCESS